MFGMCLRSQQYLQLQLSRVKSKPNGLFDLKLR